LESEIPANKKSTPRESVSIAERETLVREAPNDPFAHKVTGMVTAAAATLFAILAFVLVASFANPQRFFTMSVRTPETSQVNRSVQLVDGGKTIAHNANTEAIANPKSSTRRRSGSSFHTVYYHKIASVRRADVLLRMDLIKGPT
jgi:hypothetical protein